MKFNVFSVSDELPVYRGILEKYKPEWSYEVFYDWSVDTEVVIDISSLDEITELISEIETLNKGTVRWEENGIIINYQKPSYLKNNYPSITIYDGWNE